MLLLFAAFLNGTSRFTQLDLLVMLNAKIGKQVTLPFDLHHVWKAVTDAQQFGNWFGAEFAQQFAEGEAIQCSIVPTQVDEEIAKLQEPYRGKRFTILIEAISPQSLFSFRWHPYAVDSNFDYSNEPMTLVSFQFQECESSTELSISETGFESLPEGRRMAAFQANDGGWALQCVLLKKYLEQTIGT